MIPSSCFGMLGPSGKCKGNGGGVPFKGAEPHLRVQRPEMEGWERRLRARLCGESTWVFAVCCPDLRARASGRARDSCLRDSGALLQWARLRRGARTRRAAQ